MGAPDLTIRVEPFESRKVVYLPLAPQTKNHLPKGRLLLRLSITNNEVDKVRMEDLKLSFIGPPLVSSVTIPFQYISVDPDNVEVIDDVVIGSKATRVWSFQRPDQDVILPFPAPGTIKISVSCHDFDTPAVLTLPLAAHTSPTPVGSYLFPARASDLRPHEYWRTGGATHAIGAEGSQIFGYDMGVIRVESDPEAGWELELLSPSTVDYKNLQNADFRIWSKPIYAMADGFVRRVENNIPSNPVPLTGKEEGPALEALRTQQVDIWKNFPYGGAGNHYYIQHGDELMLYAHMQPGTLPFIKDAPVHAGDFLGLAGNSGNSGHPHLHIHAIQGVSPESGPLRPILFRDAHVISSAAFPGNPWAKMQHQGIPAVLSMIWPAPDPPFNFVVADLDKWATIVRILFGVVSDGDGLVITPGGKPIPIDPWWPLHLSPAKRDILVGLALTEFASLTSSAQSRDAIQKAGLDTMTNALSQLHKQV